VRGYKGTRCIDHIETSSTPLDPATGSSALLVSTSAGKVELIQSLSKEGYDHNTRNETSEEPFLHAAIHSSQVIIRTLLEARVSVFDDKDEQGRIPLF
jgi:ankyrin repeat protein